jgi:hypothetical protein
VASLASWTWRDYANHCIGRLGRRRRQVSLLQSVDENFSTDFNLTKENGNSPLLDLPLAKIAFLDDFRFDPDILSFATLCLWFDGSTVGCVVASKIGKSNGGKNPFA